MEIHLFFTLFFFLINKNIYTQEPKKEIVFTIPGLTALHTILQELASESSADDDDDIIEEPSIFQQLTLFIDSRLKNKAFYYNQNSKPNILSPTHLAFMTHFLEKKILMPHEAFHVIQQREGVTHKNKIRNTIEEIYNTIKSCPPELLTALKVA